MYSSPDYQSSQVQPDEFNALRDIFEHMLEESQIVTGSLRAEMLAERLISIYNSGIRDIAMLKEMVKPY
ncbi:hypothetical protein PYH37_001936 [Sinorhizobium numidicum]|uniref:Uncharacterized protein n=1 Tax=Sinorhizobium numidicum TaxID=680248 RepID=A0ABY8CSP7_9HYPH|nr:hypothetical protein [Sinorhizobium numidicum]WEX74502.1 hypothetical protein PYH37_001936 [Sinorhizobium numidicum]WEX80492.1 hypothetical protein PYH38_001938 [Sinorhizobium numidicum]